MLKNILFVAFLFFSMFTDAQELVYKSNGNVMYSQGNKMSPDQVRALLANNEKLLADYNSGRNKKTIGNVLIVGGLGLLATDFLVAVFSPTEFNENYEAEETVYPSALSYIGLAAIVVAIPVKIGFSKKIKDVVEEYNRIKTSTGFIYKTEFIANNKGLGLRLTLN